MPKCYCVMAQFGVSFFARWRDEEANVGNAFFSLFFSSLTRQANKRREGEGMEGKKKKKNYATKLSVEAEIAFPAMRGLVVVVMVIGWQDGSWQLVP